MRAYGEKHQDWATRTSRKESGRSTRGEDCSLGSGHLTGKRISIDQHKAMKRQPKKRARREAKEGIREEAP